MSRSVPNLIDLIGRMEMRKQRGFGISPETAPLVIEALRFYAQMKTGEPAKYKVEKWLAGGTCRGGGGQR